MRRRIDVHEWLITSLVKLITSLVKLPRVICKLYLNTTVLDIGTVHSPLSPFCARHVSFSFFVVFVCNLLTHSRWVAAKWATSLTSGNMDHLWPVKKQPFPLQILYLQSYFFFFFFTLLFFQIELCIRAKHIYLHHQQLQQQQQQQYLTNMSQL